MYFFYEKNTGVAHFHVESGPDGQFPVDQAAGLLAMHCMVRGQSPNDYIIMVQAESDFLDGLKEKADKLLQAGRSAGSSVKLTRREDEVLGGIMRSLANKEIAADLNLSERTVKFHVSSLLAKFRVRGRLELVAKLHATPALLLPSLPVNAGTTENCRRVLDQRECPPAGQTLHGLISLDIPKQKGLPISGRPFMFLLDPAVISWRRRKAQQPCPS